MPMRCRPFSAFRDGRSQNAMSLSQTPSIRSISGSGLICRSCPDPSRSVPWGARAGISWCPAANAWLQRPSPSEPSRVFPDGSFRVGPCCRTPVARRALGRGGWGSHHVGYRHGAVVPAHPGHQQPRAVRAQLRLALWRERFGGRAAAGRACVGGGAPGHALAQRALWQSTAGQACGHLCAGGSDAGAGLVLERIRDQRGATVVVLWNAAGQAVASAGQSRFSLNPDRPGVALLRTVRQQRATAQIEGLDDISDPAAAQNARVKVLALVSSPSVGLLVEPRYLQATLPLPPALVANAIAVQEANREYQERALARGGLRRMYVGPLTLSLFLAVFGAVWLAVLLGNQLARPLLVLAEGVREVAAGNLSPKAALQGKYELGGLTRSFALMTQQLSDARHAVEQSMGEVDAARANLQTILDNLTAGVIVLDAQGLIRSSNPGATRILRAPMAAFEGRPPSGGAGRAAFAGAGPGAFG